MTTTMATETPVEVKEDRFSITRGFFKGLLFGLMVICISLVLATVVVPRIIGAVPLTVLSGSMTPTFNSGDLLVTMPIEAEDVKRGDVITFQPESVSNSLITHRVLSVGFSLNGETVFITKGDANGAEDAPIASGQVMGKYLYHVPYLGFLANAVPSNNKSIIMQVLGGAFFVWAAYQLVSVIVSSRRKKKARQEVSGSEGVDIDELFWGLDNKEKTGRP